MRETTGIYRITNTANGWVYVGSTKHLNTRFSDHVSSLRGNRAANKKMQSDANRYGVSVFVYSILETLPNASSDDEIFEREKFHTEQAHRHGKCYNPKYPRLRLGHGKRNCYVCGEVHYAQGMCQRHWAKWRKARRDGIDVNADDFILLQKGPRND